MNSVLLATGISAGIAVLAATLLGIFSVLFAVKRDGKVQALRELLPGANCGACGYSGCDGYAEAMARGEAKPGLCTPGGEAVARATGEILGVSASVTPMRARVRCAGCGKNAPKRFSYEGIPSCRAAAAYYGGDKACSYACLGYGDCVAVCPVHALTVSRGIAAVDPEICTGCGLCAKACPKQIIELLPTRPMAFVACSSRDKGALARKYCQTPCIGCMRCQKACQQGAVTVSDSLAKIDPQKCTACGACVAVCPQGCIEPVPLPGFSAETEKSGGAK